MEGLIEEGVGGAQTDGSEEAREAALIGAAQRVEHYEIAAYGTARTHARQLGYDNAANLLEQTLKEERRRRSAHEHRGEPDQPGGQHGRGRQ